MQMLHVVATDLHCSQTRHLSAVKVGESVYHLLFVLHIGSFRCSHGTTATQCSSLVFKNSCFPVVVRSGPVRIESASSSSHILYKATKPGFSFFACILYCGTFFLPVNVFFCCVRFSFFSTDYTLFSGYISLSGSLCMLSLCLTVIFLCCIYTCILLLVFDNEFD